MEVSNMTSFWHMHWIQRITSVTCTDQYSWVEIMYFHILKNKSFFSARCNSSWSFYSMHVACCRFPYNCWINHGCHFWINLLLRLTKTNSWVIGNKSKTIYGKSTSFSIKESLVIIPHKTIFKHLSTGRIIFKRI